ncbi:hypothetical protein ACIBCO_37655 [Streptomyces violascens]|uniref:hypothetical protein n=1 Tax=Streptomyces violascens TaxID=67381 RepID=UPI00378C67BD
MDAQPAGARTQLYTFTAGSTPYNITGCKIATRHTRGQTKTSIVHWTWKGGQTAPDGTRLCIVLRLSVHEPQQISRNHTVPTRRPGYRGLLE